MCVCEGALNIDPVKRVCKEMGFFGRHQGVSAAATVFGKTERIIIFNAHILNLLHIIGWNKPCLRLNSSKTEYSKLYMFSINLYIVSFFFICQLLVLHLRFFNCYREARINLHPFLFKQKQHCVFLFSWLQANPWSAIDPRWKLL